jgi:hypothetical protein
MEIADREDNIYDSFDEKHIDNSLDEKQIDNLSENSLLFTEIRGGNELYDKLLTELSGKDEFKRLMEKGFDPIERLKQGEAPIEVNRDYVEDLWIKARDNLSDEIQTVTPIPKFNMDKTIAENKYYDWIGEDYKEFRENKHFVSRPRRTNILYYIDLITKYLENGNKGPFSLVIIEYFYPIDPIDYLFHLFPSVEFNIVIFTLRAFLYEIDNKRMFIHYTMYDKKLIKDEIYDDVLLYSNIVPLFCIKSKGLVLSRKLYQLLNVHTMKTQIEILEELNPKESMTTMFYNIMVELDDFTFDNILIMPYMTFINLSITIYNLKCKLSAEAYYEKNRNLTDATKIIRYSQWNLLHMAWNDMPSFLNKIPGEDRQYIPACYDGVYETNVFIRYLNIIDVPATTKNIIGMVYYISKQLYAYVFMKIHSMEDPQAVFDFYILYALMVRINARVYDYILNINPYEYFDSAYPISDNTQNLITEYKLGKDCNSNLTVEIQLPMIIKSIKYTSDYSCQINERKKLLSKMSFMTRYINQFKKVGLTNIYIIGSASKHVAELIYEMPYSYVWTIYSPDICDELVDMSVKFHTKVKLFKKEFTLEDAKLFKESQKSFVNYLVMFDLDNNRTSEENNLFQFESYKITDPLLTMFNFKYSDVDIAIPAGTFYIYPWNDSKLETYLICDKGAAFTNLNKDLYINNCNYYYGLKGKKFDNLLSILPVKERFGLNDLFDSCLELTILYNWMKLKKSVVKISDLYRFIENMMNKKYLEITCKFPDYDKEPINKSIVFKK